MSFNSEAIALLRKAAERFRYYEECHRNKVTYKVTTEADRIAIEKAEANAEIAQEIEDFLDAL